MSTATSIGAASNCARYTSPTLRPLTIRCMCRCVTLSLCLMANITPSVPVPSRTCGTPYTICPLRKQSGQALITTSLSRSEQASPMKLTSHLVQHLFPFVSPATPAVETSLKPPLSYVSDIQSPSLPLAARVPNVEPLIVHILRTNQMPFLQSSASAPLMLTTGLVCLIGLWLRFSPVVQELRLMVGPRSLRHSGSICCSATRP